MAHEGIINLEDFADWHGVVNGVELRSELQLPEYVPASDITVNLGRIASAARLGRLEHLRFSLYSKAPETSSFSMSGINPNGTATASAAGIKKAQRSSSSISTLSSDGERFPRGRSHTKINIAHPDLNYQALRTPQPWANLLDKSMREGLRESGSRQLGQPRLERAVHFGSNAFFYSLGASIMVAIAPNITIADMCYSVPIVMTATEGLGLLNRLESMARKKPVKDHEHSLLPGLPVDRMLALHALMRMRKIVTVK